MRISTTATIRRSTPFFLHQLIPPLDDLRPLLRRRGTHLLDALLDP